MTHCLIAWMAFGAAPPDVIAGARQDIESIPDDVRPYIRFLSLDEIKPEARDIASQVLSGHVNSLSRESETVPVVRVGSLLRINLKDYGWPVETWEKLAKADPYYHVKVATDWPGGIWPADGKTYAKGTFRYVQDALAPWMAEGENGPANLAALVGATRSQVPVIRADHFFNLTAAAVDRDPNYYTFLGIKNLADYQKLVGFDPKRKRNKVETRESVAESGVSLQPRAIVRQDTDEGGFLWTTLDIRKATDRVNPLRVLGRDFEKNWNEANKKDAAQELIGSLPNGMVAYGLFNNAGELQDSAPDFIASDTLAHGRDKRVHNPVSCVRCHEGRSLQSIDGWVRGTFQDPLSLNAPDYENLRLQRQQYGKKLDPILERDKELYERSVIEATDVYVARRGLPDRLGGLKAKDYHQAYAALWHRTEDFQFDLDAAAADLGVPAAKLRVALEQTVRRGFLDDLARADLVLTSLLKGKTLDKTQWAESFPLAKIALAANQKGP